MYQWPLRQERFVIRKHYYNIHQPIILRKNDTRSQHSNLVFTHLNNIMFCIIFVFINFLFSQSIWQIQCKNDNTNQQIMSMIDILLFQILFRTMKNIVKQHYFSAPIYTYFGFHGFVSVFFFIHFRDENTQTLSQIRPVQMYGNYLMVR